MNTQEEILSIVKNLNDYYSFGNYHASNGKIIESIVDDKINSIINKKGKYFKNWNNIIESIILKIGINNVINLSNLQSPSIIASIDFFEEKYANFTYRRQTIIAVSLLVKYYTIFQFENFFPKNEQLYYNNELHKYISNVNDTNRYDFINTEIENNFDGYQFLSPSLIFRYKLMGSIPWGIDIMDNANIEVLIRNDYPIGLFIFGEQAFF
jgi:hypothetical protein